MMQPRTVLIVDDEQAVCAAFGRALRSKGYIALTASSAEDAWHFMSVAHPDAIVLDLRMPQVDGLEFLRQLRQRDEFREARVGIVTGDHAVSDAMASELRDLRIDELRLKPVSVQELVALVEQLISPNSRSGEEQAGVSGSSEKADARPGPGALRSG